MLNWLVEDKQITPHIPVIDKSRRQDGTFSREQFHYDTGTDIYVCPTGKTLTTSGTLVNDGATLLYRGSTRDCVSCPLKARARMPASGPPQPQGSIRVVNCAPSSATKTAINSAQSVLLALAETRWIAPGGSKND